jgi:site-specific recombinase XerD
MSRKATVWWNAQKGSWCTDFGGQRRTLAKGRKARSEAVRKLDALIEEQGLLDKVHGPISVAGLCESFLEDAEQHLERSTYESYKYCCQKLTDVFAPRKAHTIEPLDIQRFSKGLKTALNDTSRAIVLRVVQRCFNWGAEMRLIPAHQLGRIRKPRAKSRDRFLTNDEFQSLLRGTNPRNGHHSGAAFRRLLLALDWTMCRPGEIARLKWEHIHWDHDVAILPDHKTKRTGKPKIIALVPKMKRLLEWLKRRSKSELCFVNRSGRPWTVRSINLRMRFVRERSGVTDIMPYTIRHRAATNAILRTGDLKMTSLLLGHRSTATTERYTHLAQGHLVTFAKKAIG